ncbi:amidase family protein [Pelagicoccus sp. SDUM812003]|uniref:amidase family protein n=1 Tax=Pelagicoccus sp. SDUM812003 TaxID=3041267 RepID=UPI00280ED94A|nr:amidase family protein [Pelagicoccus sp. SDUM812003]MDQ8204679.1 amidase family protein [Pelagicoccus sp. SDUM812003]
MPIHLLKPFVAASILITGALAPCSAKTFDLSTANIADVQEAMDAGALTAEKLVQLYLNRIEAYDKKGPKINTVITLNPNALAEARALDKERAESGPRSQLHGIPVVFKDLVDIVGLPTTAGHVPFGAPIPKRDATLVAKLKDAGAIMLAKVSTRNWFGSWEQHPIGLTLNPYKPGYSPGFTSNGSGAAIASYFSQLAIGTDNSASVQHPSANSSVVGMVASQGMVSRAGVLTNSATQDRPGPMARSVYDVAAMISVMAGWDAEDLMTFRPMGHFPESDWSLELGDNELVGKRIGVLREMIYEGEKHEEARKLFEIALEDMRRAGAFVVDPILTGIDLKEMTRSAYISPARYEKRPHQEVYLKRLGDATKWDSIQTMYNQTVEPEEPLPMPGTAEDSKARYAARQAIIDLIHETMDRFDLDAIALPYRTLPPEPYPGPRPPESTTNLTSCTGLPAVIVPGGYIPDNRPIGIQIFGRQYDDLNVLKIAHGYELASKNRKTPALTPPLDGEVFEY